MISPDRNSSMISDMMIKNWLNNLPVRQKLTVCFLPVILATLALSDWAIFSLCKAHLEKDLDSKLNRTVTALSTVIVNTMQLGASEHLRIVSEKNHNCLSIISKRQPNSKKAKDEARKFLAEQKVGNSGYIYAVNSHGIIEAHPDKTLIGEDFSGYTHIGEQKKKRFGYMEYEIIENHEDTPRLMALYMTYFSPWDWIISATASKKEFLSTLKPELLRNLIRSVKPSECSYSFIIDSEGNTVVHPKNDKKNIASLEDEEGQRFIEDILTRKNGQLTFKWKAEKSNAQHDWKASFQYIPEMNWIVVSASDIQEEFKSLRTFKLVVLTTIIFTAVVILVLTWLFSRMITKPLKYLMRAMQAASSGDYSIRLHPSSNDEPGRLEAFYNTFMARLQESSNRLNRSEKGFRSIFENSVEGIFEFDLNGTILKVNPSFVAMLGFDNSKSLLMANLNMKRNVIVKKELWNSLIDKIISEGAVKGFEMEIYRKSGTACWCLLNARKIQSSDHGNSRTRVEGFLSDINDRKIAQETQKKMMEDLEHIVTERTIELSDRISELEQRNEMNKHLGQMADMLQACRSINEIFPIIKQYLTILFPTDSCSLYLEDPSKKMFDRVIPPLTKDDPFNTIENCWALRQGKPYIFNDMHMELACSHVDIANTKYGYLCIPLMAHGKTIGLLHTSFGKEHNKRESNELVERKKRLASRLTEHLALAISNLKLQEELKQKSIQDSLTGLSNRRHMEEILQRQMNRMLRHETPCSIIMLDVDHFKSFNDTYGHDIGDCVLKELGRYLKKNTRGEDLAARYGGEEFIIILANTEIERATRKAETIRKDIAKTLSVTHNGKSLNITVSLGVSSGPAHGSNIEELLKAADTALYQAKENGRNRVVSATSPQ